MYHPVNIQEQTLADWNRLRRPSDVAHIARELGCTKQLIYDAFYRRRTSERVFLAISSFYTKRSKSISERIRQAKLDLNLYENSAQ